MLFNSKFSPRVCISRQSRDIHKLKMSDFIVTNNKKKKNSFTVLFNGPKDSLYERGKWDVNVELPE